ncbi:MAG: hypothetical protein QOI06_3114 [Nocardioidaceae bacterium]|jgi:hypothetical protein|nr:hypothetical protein [Nocardioidaceae bacterium]
MHVKVAYPSTREVSLAPTEPPPSRVATGRSKVVLRGENVLTGYHCDQQPIDPVTSTEAAAILGCSVLSVQACMAAGTFAGGEQRGRRGMSRGEVEELAIHVYAWLCHRNDPNAYWVIGQRAAQTLGVDRDTLERLTAAGRLPCTRHDDGTLLYRRRDLLYIRHSREARTWSATTR